MNTQTKTFRIIFFLIIKIATLIVYLNVLSLYILSLISISLNINVGLHQRLYLSFQKLAMTVF